MKVTKATNLLRRFILLAVLPLATPLFSGCAAAYYNCPGCYGGCKYCIPSPLPFANYKEKVCHSDVVSNYLPFSAGASEANPQAEPEEVEN